MEKKERDWKAHVLLLPFPGQGHINPMLQFSKRLASKGLRVTLAITRFIHKSMKVDPGSVNIETVSDGFDEGGSAEAESIEIYMERFEVFGSQTLIELIDKQEKLGFPIKCVIYDSIMTWALEVAKGCGLTGASFFTQSCAVDAIYYNIQSGVLSTPFEGDSVTIPGLPLLRIHELPSFIYASESYPFLRALVLSQFSNFEKADWLLCNSFDKLESEVVKWMAKKWRIKTIGPTLPSMYLDKRVEEDKDYGLNLFKPNVEACMEWLNTKEVGSVVYVSFGSLATLGEEQMEELAFGLKSSNKPFLWVVRESEETKLPSKFIEETYEKGLVVRWCPQLEVLGHHAVGCFVTHCGWNSTLEALSLGVPMVAMPQWTDQTTNAKFIEDVWEVGIKVKVDDNGVVRKEEVELCIRKVMEGEKGEKLKKNAVKWKEFAKEAVNEGGSSDKNIEEFVNELLLKC